MFRLRNVHPLALGLTMLPVGDLPPELEQSANWRGRVELEALSAMRSADEYVVRIGIELLYFGETPSEHATAAARRLLRSGSPGVQNAAERYFDRIARDRRATESSGIETK